MIKHSLFDKKTESCGKILRWYLFLDNDNLCLNCLDERGCDWNILAITKDGELNRFAGISHGTGLALDKGGHIMISE